MQIKTQIQIKFLLQIQCKYKKSTCGAAFMWCMGTSCSPAAEETAASKAGLFCKSLNCQNCKKNSKIMSKLSGEIQRRMNIVHWTI